MISQALVQPGDTIVTLAARLTGDPRLFDQLITLNNLQPPYITPTPQAGRLAPGQPILYRRTDASPAPTESGELNALTYKRDLIEDRGNLVLAGSTPQKVTGLENLKAALERRLKTPLGAHPSHPLTYGSLIHTHLGRPADRARLDLITTDARTALLQDPRVRDATVTAWWEDQLTMITCNVVPIAPGTPFAITVAFA